MKLSTLAVRCRSVVERDSYTREVELIPEPEAPARLALVLLRLLNALQAIGVAEREAWRLVEKCALDSMPALRRTVLDDLLRVEAAASTSEVAERIAYPTTTTRRALEDLAAYGIVQRQTQGPGRPDVWQVSAWTRRRWPTVPEMSEDGAAVPEMSEGSAAEAESTLASAPITLPLRAYDDISGAVPPPDILDDDAEPWMPKYLAS